MENNAIHKKVESFLKRQKQDYIFNTIIGSLMSFCVTVLFALYNGFLGIHNLSVWHGSICVFYLLLAMIRGTILLTKKNNIKRDEIKRNYYSRRTFIISAVMLLILNLALILPISLMVILEKPVNMGLIPAITMATYTTYRIIIASIHMNKQRRISRNDPLVAELRIINFIEALVSVLTLQNTLIVVNQTASDSNDMLILSAVSSAVIYLVIVYITIHMLIKGLKNK